MTDLLALISQRLDRVAADAGSRSAEIEASRALPDDLVADLIESGVFRLTVPERNGGLGVGLTSLLRAVERMAHHDPSVGWCVLAGLVSGLDAYELGDHQAQAIHGDPATLAVGDRHSLGGEARVRDDGSLVVTGRWGWGAAAAHCTWIGGTVRVVDDGGAPSALVDGATELYVYLSRDQVTVLDTWHPLGLRAAGATDYLANDVVVPVGRWRPTRYRADSEELPATVAPADAFALGAAVVAVGAAGRAVEELAALGADATSVEGGRLADSGPARLVLARAQAAVRAVRSDLYAIAGRVDRTEPGRPVAPVVTANLVSAAAHGVQIATDVVEGCYRVAGPTAIHHASPLQRLLRDVEVIAQHPSVSIQRLDVLGRDLFAAAVAPPPPTPTEPRSH